MQYTSVIIGIDVHGKFLTSQSFISCSDKVKLTKPPFQPDLIRYCMGEGNPFFFLILKLMKKE